MVRIHQRYHIGSFGRWNQINQQIRCLEVIFYHFNHNESFFPKRLVIDKNWIKLHAILSRYLISFKNLLRAIENIGIVSVYGIKYLTTGKVTQENFIKYVEHDTLIWEYLNSSVHLAPYLEDKLQNIYSTTAYQFYRER